MPSNCFRPWGEILRLAEVGGMPGLAAQLGPIWEGPSRQSWTPVIDGVPRCRLGPECNGAEGPTERVHVLPDARRALQRRLTSRPQCRHRIGADIWRRRW